MSSRKISLDPTFLVIQNVDFSQWNLGFCFVKGVPVDPESTKALIERIAFVRHTHYGILVYLTDMPGH